MNRFLRPGRCLDCGTAVSTQTRCPSCALVLTGRVADDLRAALAYADQILDVLRRVSVAEAGASAAGTPAVTPATAGLSTATTRRRGLPAVSVPWVLLGLGTVCVLVAAIVFVAVTWTDLSLAWRTTILLAVTSLGTTAAVWTLRRGLRGAAEALSLVAAGLLLIDLLAGNSAGLPGVSALRGTAFGWLVTLVMLATALAWVLGAQHTRSRSLLGQQAVAVLALLAAVYLSAIGWDYGHEWLGAVLAVAAAASGGAVRRLRMPVVAGAAAVVALCSWLLLAALGVGRAVAADGPGELFLGLDSLPVLVAAAMAAVLTAVPGVPARVRTVAAVPAVAGPVLVALLPVRELAFTPAVVVVGVAAVVLVALAPLLRDRWVLAVVVTGLGTAVLPGYAVLDGAVMAIARVGEAVDPLASDLWAAALTDALAPVRHTSAVEVFALPVVTGLFAAAVAAAVLRRVPHLFAWAGAGVVAGAVQTALLTSWPLVVIGLLLAAGAAAGVALALRTGLRRWLVASGVLVLLGLLTGLPSATATAVFFTVHAALLVGMAWGLTATGARVSLAAAAASLLGVSVEACAHLADLGFAAGGVVLVVFASAVALAAQPLRRREWALGWRLGLELGAVLLALVAVLQSTDDAVPLSTALTVLGVGTVLVSLVSVDRRRWAWAGSAALVLASWVRLAEADVEAVEAYTLPGSVALLVAGLLWMRRDGAATSWRGLMTPLGLGLGPSLAVAAEEPTSLRALLVGLVGLGLVLAAVRLRWAAPLLVGGIAVGALAVVNIAPYAAALPRWILFAAAGITLLGLGVTWEQRRHDLAVMHRYAGTLR